VSSYRFYHIDTDGIEYPITDEINTFLLTGGMFGFGLLRLETAAQRVPYEHGVTPTGEPYLPEREMIVIIGIKDTTHAAWIARDAALRDNCSPFRAPAQRCTLKIVRPDDTVRYIKAWLVEYPQDIGDLEGTVYGKRALTYWAPDPAFYDPTAVVASFGVSPGGGFTFPFTCPFTFVAVADSGGFTFPMTFPLTFSAANVTTRQTIAYAGTMPTLPVVRCYGPADYPLVENETLGKAVQVVQAMESGDYIDIDMATGVVTFYDATDGSTTDVTNLITDDTEFWRLQPGENVIRVAMVGTSSNGVQLTYYDRYLAV